MLTTSELLATAAVSYSRCHVHGSFWRDLLDMQALSSTISISLALSLSFVLLPLGYVYVVLKKLTLCFFLREIGEKKDNIL